jgi:hypothetical protein
VAIRPDFTTQVSRHLLEGFNQVLAELAHGAPPLVVRKFSTS